MKIKKIKSKKAIEIIFNYKPIGKFLVKEKKCWVAIDNTTGDAFTEEFKTKKKAKKYLKYYEN